MRKREQRKYRVIRNEYGDGSTSYHLYVKGWFFWHQANIMGTQLFTAGTLGDAARPAVFDTYADALDYIRKIRMREIVDRAVVVPDETQH